MIRIKNVLVKNVRKEQFSNWLSDLHWKLKGQTTGKRKVIEIIRYDLKIFPPLKQC